MIRCSDGSLYTGVSTDVERRFAEHLTGKRGARYFQGRRPEAIVYRESGHDRSSALRREAAIKALRREQKLALIGQGS
ncbi:MAG: GIY-YIG nuclease family protein [Xanthomonadales bacterium]|nr:GIY-YIG nuclease family protein [Xanthomonadales bacterium]